MDRRTFIKRAGIGGLGTLAIGGGTYLYGVKLEPPWIETVHVTVQLSRLDRVFHGYRIVQISDIHADRTWMDVERLDQIVAQINSLNPNMVVITGDFITLRHSRMAETLSALEAIQAPDGVFAIMGNHDHWSGLKKLRQSLEAAHVQELPDKIHTIQRSGAMLHLIGMDDLWARSDQSHKDILTLLLKQIPGQGSAILLVHEPDFADISSMTRRIDLQLSGHSHGGQVRIPGYGALRLPFMGKKYQAGLYRVGSMLHYTNRGVGMMHPQVRFNCRPEITLFTCEAP